MKLSVLKNNELVSEIDLGKEVEGVSSTLTFFVGRADTCHVVLDDPQISREHAELTYSAGGWTIKKISELSLMIVNGNVTNQAQLNSGDVLSIGPFSINIYIPLAAPTAAPAITETAIESPTETLPANGEEPATEVMSMDQLETEADNVESLDELESVESLDDIGGEESVSETSEEDGFSPVDENEDEDLFSEEGESNEFENDGFDEGFGDDSEANDEYGMTGFDDEDSGEKTMVFTSFAKFELELFGEFAPYDRYVVESPEVKIGRDSEKCQIVLQDPEVSSVHAAIKKNNILCVLEDLQSANGTIHNGSRINSIELTNGDEFIIGSTTFTVKVVSDLLDQEKDRLMPVEDNQVVEVEEIQEVATDFSDGEDDLFFDGEESEGFGAEKVEPPKSLVGKFKLAWKDPAKRKRIIIGMVILAALWVMLDDGDSGKKSPAIQKKATTSKVDDQGKAKLSAKKKKNLSPEQLEYVSSRYELAKQHIDSGNYNEAIIELESVMNVDDSFKQTQQLYELAKQGRAKLEKAEQERIKKLQEAERKRKIKKLLEMATKAVNDHLSAEAKEIFSQIALLDPNNFEVEQLKSRLKAWEAEQERIAVEKAQKEADRKRKVEQLKPGKTLFIKKDWFNSILHLERFLKIKNMDEDLTKEASDMLHEAKEKLNSVVGPLVGKARSLKEGQDLKGAYESYAKALKYDPNNAEALNEMNEIREVLHLRAKRVYREAIIAESLSLFKSAKEKFQEVQQIAPTDSEYYEKATNKLKEYME